MASTILNRTPSSTGNRKKWTLSMWIKNSNLKGQGGSSYQRLYQADNDNEYFRFTESTGKLLWLTNNGSSGGFLTTRVFRDTNAWYHLVLRIDTTLGTAGDRSRLYVNGVEETAFDTENQVAQDYDTYSNCISKVMQFGGYSTSDQNFNGCMSHVHMCDGYSYAPTEFGETDSTTGEWKIKTVPSVSYGTNGFFILKDGNSVTDQSGQGNNLTVSGTLTKTEDCPSNVFATMNPLDNQNQGSTFTIGNTKLEWNTNNKNNFANFAINKGKFYWEMKYANATGGTDAMIGMSLADTRQADDYPGHDATAWSYYASNGNKYHSGGSSYGNSWAANDIIGVAFDADTRTLWFSKNGDWQNSATKAEIAAGTTTNAAWTGMGSAGQYFIPCMSGYDGNKAEFNFGNGYFSTTQITSAGSNASNIGLFEYDVPDNFTALCTKGLNE
jgi:hypothetical protein